MLPPASDYLYHPIRSTAVLIEVLRLHEAHKSARISEKRKRNVDDVAKRAAYRKAHGLPEEMGLFNQPMAKIRDEDGESGAAAAAEGSEKEKEQQRPQPQEAGAGGTAEAQSEGGHGPAAEPRRLTEEERQAVVKETKGRWLGIF
jgi:hypothetical protein